MIERWGIMTIFLIIIMITFYVAAKILKRDMEDSVYILPDWDRRILHEEYECMESPADCEDCERCKSDD